MTKEAPDRVYRVVPHAPDPSDLMRPWTPWPLSKRQERYDDPKGEYWVLYASTEPLGCYLELLYQFRVAALPGLAAIQNTVDDHIRPGTIPSAWLRERLIGSAQMKGRFADVGSAEWISRLRNSIPRILFEPFGVADFNLSTLYQAEHRAITQQIARHIYEEGYDGIYYASKHGTDIGNWAIFHGRAEIVPVDAKTVTAGDPAFVKARNLLRLSL